MEKYTPTLDEELTLFGTWLLDKNREDVSLFEADVFEQKEIFKGIKAGYNFSQLKDKGLNKIVDSLGYKQELGYADFYKSATDNSYIGAKATALLTQKDLYIKQLTDGKHDTAEVTKKINELQAVIDGKTYQPIENDFTEEFIKELQERLAEENPQYGTGFKDLDKYTGGIHRGQLTVIGARPRIGKSAIALQIAGNVVDQGYKVMYLPLEMTTYETIMRLLLQQQIVEREDLDNPTEETIEIIKNYLNQVRDDNNFYIGAGVNQLVEIEKRIKEQQPYLVVIDQLSLINTPGKSKDIREKTVEITRSLKRIAMENKVAIILLSQMNRASKGKRCPGIEELSESDSTGQDADNVFTLYVENEEQEIHEIERETFLYIAKQRNGIDGKKIALSYRGDRFTFSPLDYTEREINIVD